MAELTQWLVSEYYQSLSQLHTILGSKTIFPEAFILPRVKILTKRCGKLAKKLLDKIFAPSQHFRGTHTQYWEGKHCFDCH